jgi:ABC-type polysaccharide/polyol phosphate export permease
MAFRQAEQTIERPRQFGALPFVPDRFSRLVALIDRERHTRFAGGSLSSLWAYLTPIGWIVLVVLAFAWLGRTIPILAPMPIFVAAGILPYAMFRQVISSLMRTVISNRHLLYLPPVTTGDILLASALLELLNMIVTTTVIFGALWLFLGADAPHDPLRAIWGMALAWALGAGFGRLAAVLGLWSDTLYRSIPLLLRPMFWISGVFFTATELGGMALDALSWNPLFHVIETLREGLFLGYVSPLGDSNYPLYVAVGFYLLSLVFERWIEAARLSRHWQ